VERNQTLTSANSWIDDFVERIYETDWQKCPFCGEDSTKLKPCHFFWDKKMRVIKLCLDCSESAGSLRFVNTQYPIPGIHISFKYLPSYKINVVFKERFEEYIDKNKRIGIVTYNDYHTYYIVSKNTPPYIVCKRGDDENCTFSDNILAAWSKIEKNIKGEIDDESM
jgi:hypothetical protein